MMPDGRIGHVELRIGDAVFMMADEFADIDVLGPSSRGGTTVSFVINVPDVDTVYARAVDAGAIAERPVEDQFYGSRAGWLSDPWGHRWSISTPLAAVPGRLAERDLGTAEPVPVVDLGDRAEPDRTAADDVVNLGYFSIGVADVDRASRLLLRPLRLAAGARLPDEGRHIGTSRPPGGLHGGEDGPVDHPLLPGARHPGGGGEGASARRRRQRTAARRVGMEREPATTTRASPSTSGSRPRATDRRLTAASAQRQLMTGTSRYSRSMS